MMHHESEDLQQHASPYPMSKMTSLRTWHPHVYANPPKQPTPHFIIDILGDNSLRQTQESLQAPIEEPAHRGLNGHFYHRNQHFHNSSSNSSNCSSPSEVADSSKTVNDQPLNLSCPEKVRGESPGKLAPFRLVPPLEKLQPPLVNAPSLGTPEPSPNSVGAPNGLAVAGTNCVPILKGKAQNPATNKPSKRKKEPKPSPQPDGNNNKSPTISPVPDGGTLSNISLACSSNGNSNCSSILNSNPGERTTGCTSDTEGSDKGKRKKARTTFTGRQIFELEKQFEVKKYLSSSERSDMAKLLNVTETQDPTMQCSFLLLWCLVAAATAEYWTTCDAQNGKITGLRIGKCPADQQSCRVKRGAKIHINIDLLSYQKEYNMYVSAKAYDDTFEYEMTCYGSVT